MVLQVDMETTRDSIANFLYFQNVSVRDLSEVRKLFEPHLAAIAAERLSPAELEKLEATHRTSLELLERGENIYKYEIEFHRILSRTSGNPVFILILDFVNSVLADSKHHLGPGLDFLKEVLAAHQRILEAIRAGDPELAASEMFQHVCEVEESLEALRRRREQRGKAGSGLNVDVEGGRQGSLNDEEVS